MNFRSFLALCLLIVLMLVGCAPAEVPAPAQSESTVQPPATMEEANEDPPTPVPSENENESPVADPGSTGEPTMVLEPEFVPRGPNLEATDPTTVSLNSGELQLVEFFRYTWGTCRSMAPMVHGLEAQYYGKIKFSYLDADDSRTDDFQRVLGFAYQPEFYLLDGQGNVLKKWIGRVSQEDFEAAFAPYVQ